MVRAVDRLVDLVGRGVAWISAVIVLLMAVNVVLRYLFSVGSVWAQELEWHLLAPLVLFGMSEAYQKGEHVRVDVGYARFSPRARLWIDTASAFLCVAISIIVVWLSLHYVQQSYVIDEGSPDPGGLTHRWLLKGLIPAGFALLALTGIAQSVKGIVALTQARR